jgi:hypothetical protein
VALMLNLSREEYREKVLAAAKAKLKDYPWFSGVCMDDVDECYPDFEEGVNAAYCNTLVWDAPNMGFDLASNPE